MQTNFTPEQLSNPAMAYSNSVLVRCLQCGYCLENCPTFQLSGDELQTPRGRVAQIKNMLESEGRPEDETVENIDRCMSCLACLSTCPSFVNYMHLVDHAREHIEENYQRPLLERALRWTIARILPYPGRLRLAMHGARLLKPLTPVMPGRTRGMVELIPNKLPPPSLNDRPQVFPALGERKRRVALMAGCAQKALNTDINDATISVLRRHGCEVVIPQGAGCCGALTHHMGKSRESHAAAAASIQTWMAEVNGAGLDAIVINTSGCGTVIKDYGHMFRNEDLAEEAATISSLAKDISEVLTEIKLDYVVKPSLRVAYHATCSLQFGQRIRFAPRKLLKAAGFTVLEPANSHVCCGSAGTYNLLQPEISGQLRERKVNALEAIQPDAIAAGNIGCIVQISHGTEVPVVHTVELLDWVTGGPIPSCLEGNIKAATDTQQYRAEHGS
ncbi:MAG: glycolate oxidase iron-sulfur subunit [Gammaproteobacteria bacterium]|nr:MAG: glycolate oxidase iron-sulfur subunit [Gammaproteobacteria bacterium]